MSEMKKLTLKEALERVDKIRDNAEAERRAAIDAEYASETVCALNDDDKERIDWLELAHKIGHPQIPHWDSASALWLLPDANETCGVRAFTTLRAAIDHACASLP